MDALDALENAEALATPTRGCKRPPDEAMTPQVLAIRRRLLFPRVELADEAGVDKAEATEGSPMVDKALALVGDATSTHGKDRDQGIRCHGCTRTPERNDFVRAGDVVSWALPDIRGCWCKDCFTVFRTYYNSIKRIKLFSKWMQADEANWHQFVHVLITYLSLAREGYQQIRQAMIDKRLTCLRWVLVALHSRLEDEMDARKLIHPATGRGSVGVGRCTCALFTTGVLVSAWCDVVSSCSALILDEAHIRSSSYSELFQMARP